MGTNQHLVPVHPGRFARKAAWRSRNGDRVVPDRWSGATPAKPSSPRSLRTAAHRAHHTAVSMQRWPTRTTPCSSMRPPRRCARPCSARRSPPASTSTAKSRSPPAWRRRSASCARPRPPASSHGVVQDKLFLPGLRKLKLLIDSGFFGRILVGAAASSATGCSRATCSRPSARRGTIAPRTAAASSSTCSATGATCSTTPSATSSRCPASAPRTSPSASTRTGKRYKATADDAAYATFQLDGGIIAHFNCSWCHARAPRRSAHPARRRHARLGRGGPAGRRHPAAHGRRRSRSGTPTSSRPIDFYAGWQPVPETQSLRQRLQAAVGGLHPPRRARTRTLQVGPAGGRQGRAAGRVRAAQLEERAVDGCAGAEGLSSASAQLPDHRLATTGPGYADAKFRDDRQEHEQ